MFRSESEFVSWLQTLGQARPRRLRVGVGDDAAVIAQALGYDTLLTTDLSIEGIHFDRDLHPPAAVGHRALARSLSDIAAMGGVPRFALVSMALSRRLSRSWVEEFYAGLFALARRSGVTVAGGDTAVAPGKMAFDVTVLGDAPLGRALVRSSARPGDQLFVSGRLGLSALGLRLLQSHRRRLSPAERRAIRAHLYPEARCRLGRLLAEKRLASAAIDLSDGLSSDLARLLEASGVGAKLWAASIPAPDTRRLAGLAFSREALFAFALDGGEDYELLFAVPRRNLSHLPRRFENSRLHHIGEITAAKKCVLIEADGGSRTLEPAGYDHFRRSGA